MARYHITIIRPQEYLHSECFREVAEGLHYALLELGHSVRSLENWIDRSATTIIFGAHLMSEAQAMALPPQAVVYNLEPLGGYTVPGWYCRIASVVPVWDYTSLNLTVWQAVPCLVPVRVMEIGYVPQLTRISSVETQDIDVLFYGAVTERRSRIFDALTAAGIKVHVAYGVYGTERDALIARSKLVLNLHAEETGIFETVRVSYLLANRKAVVAEESNDFGPLRDAVAACTYESAVDVCRRLLADSVERRELEERGFQIFSERLQTTLLAEALA